MFVSDEATLDVSFDVALARLAALAGNGVLRRVSADAYAAGAAAGSPWISMSCLGDLITRPDRAVLAVRWETGSRAGGLFPVLDADLTLTRPDRAPPCSSWPASTGSAPVKPGTAWPRWPSAVS